MKKLMLVCCFLVGATMMSFAQGRQMRSPEEQAKALQTRLKLTDDQTAKATAIFTAQAAKRDSVMKAANGDRQAMMQAMRPMRQETNAKIEALLTTDEQKAEYKKMQEEMRNRMGGGGQGGGTPPPPTK